MVILYLCVDVVVFFVKQKTAYEMRISDWSSDVCSSDLATDVGLGRPDRNARPPLHKFQVEIVGKLLGDQLAGISIEDEPAEIGNDGVDNPRPGQGQRA